MLNRANRLKAFLHDGHIDIDIIPAKIDICPNISG